MQGLKHPPEHFTRFPLKLPMRPSTRMEHGQCAAQAPMWHPPIHTPTSELVKQILEATPTATVAKDGLHLELGLVLDNDRIRG